MFIPKPNEEQETLMVAGALIATGKKIQAIKLLRAFYAKKEVETPGLKETKDFVDYVSQQLFPGAFYIGDSLKEAYDQFRQRS